MSTLIETPIRNLVWLRNDLRSSDNTALWNARQRGSCACVFLITPEQWRQHAMAPIKVDFILRNLAALAQRLEQLHIPLFIRECPDFSSAPQVLMDLCHSLGATDIYSNREYLVNEMRRDQAVQSAASAAGIGWHAYHDSLVVPPGMLKTLEGGTYRVFTSFRRAWVRMVEASPPELLPEPQAQAPLTLRQAPTPTSVRGFSAKNASAWPIGEARARQRLRFFLEGAVDAYHTGRDLPALDGTSRLSASLAVGSISVRECLQAGIAANSGEIEGINAGARHWISELVWREFYYHLTYAYPDLCKGKAFQAHTDAVRWRNSESDLHAWKRGETGQPLVDAGMRQLLQEGWMHNRLRMVTAMFLTKNLLLDWRLGERWFMQHLVDGDFALNNGGWQWSASTGTDAAPYFRVFNSFSQGQKCDPDAAYIKRYVPELAHLPPQVVQDEIKLAANRPENYPALIVDMKGSRAAAIEAFAKLRT